MFAAFGTIYTLGLLDVIPWALGSRGFYRFKLGRSLRPVKNGGIFETGEIFSTSHSVLSKDDKGEVEKSGEPEEVEPK
jgi:hypothetical protein